MLPEWEKGKIQSQNKSNEYQVNDDSRKNQNAIPVPVVKDASEFRELTQVGLLLSDSVCFQRGLTHI